VNKAGLIIFIFSFHWSVLFGQDTLLLRSDNSEIIDVMISSATHYRGYPSSPEISGIAWTGNLKKIKGRGFIDFDLSTLPEGIELKSASLSLYSIVSMHNGNHSTSGGSNESVLQRVISDWDVKTLNWSNQPYTTSVNEVILIESISENEDYLDIDITALVQDILEDRECSFGFMLRLVEEMYYRKMIFASTDYLDSSKHPTLQIIYTKKK